MRLHVVGAEGRERMKLYNATPHEVTLRAVDGSLIRLPAAEAPARVHLERLDRGVVCGVKIVVPVVVGVNNLPARRDDTLIVVSKIVADALPERQDLVVPDLIEYDESGAVVAAGALARLR